MSEENTNGNQDQNEESSTPATEPGSEGASGELASDEKTMGMLCHLLGIFTWFLGPLIIWLIKKDTSEYVNDQGKEALNFQITLAIGYVASGIITCFTLGLGSPLMGIVWVLNLVFCIMGAIAANNGERYRYPFAIRLIK